MTYLAFLFFKAAKVQIKKKATKPFAKRFCGSAYFNNQLLGYIQRGIVKTFLKFILHPCAHGVHTKLKTLYLQLPWQQYLRLCTLK